MFFDDYIKYINTLTSQNKNDSLGYFHNEEGNPTFHDFRFYNVILFLYVMNVKSTDVRLKQIMNLTDYMKFLLFREKSDLTKFKLEWLQLFLNRKIIYEKISKIKGLKRIIEQNLKVEYNKDIADIFTKYFLT